MDYTHPYIASLTGNHSLFYEMRAIAKLLVEGYWREVQIKGQVFGKIDLNTYFVCLQEQQKLPQKERCI